MKNDNCLNNQNGHSIVVVSGPSGSGKSTLIHRLMKRHKEIVFSISHTTREKRGREINGRDYHFISKEDFLEMKVNDGFVEWAEVYGNYYGTSYREIENKCKDGRILVLDIDVQGACNIKNKYPGALFIFLVPPSMEELERRLKKRDADNNIKIRLKIASDEFKQYMFYDYIVINDDLDHAFRVLNSIYVAHMNRTYRHHDFMKERLLGNIDKS